MDQQLTEFTYFRGRVAMAAILRAIGVRKGDEVVIQAFTCVAVPEAVLSIGAVPRYADVVQGTPNMDPASLAAMITPATRAVVIQHSFGLPADVKQLAQVSRNASIPMIEDCAHTVDSRVDGQPVGAVGVEAFYSYEASKPLFVGIGGSAVVNDSVLSRKIAEDYASYAEPGFATQLQLNAMRLAHRIAYRPSTYWKVRGAFRALVKAGVIKGNYNRVEDESGPSEDFGRRMGPMQASLLKLEIRNLEANSAHRRHVADEYRARIKRNGITHFDIPPGVDPVFGRYPLLVDDKPKWVEGARDAKVELADFYNTAVHPLRGDVLRRVGYEPGSCPNAEWISEHVLSMPTGSRVSASQIDRTVRYF